VCQDYSKLKGTFLRHGVAYPTRGPKLLSWLLPVARIICSNLQNGCSRTIKVSWATPIFFHKNIFVNTSNRLFFTNKRLSYRRGTARCAVSGNLVSAQLFEKSLLLRLAACKTTFLVRYFSSLWVFTYTPRSYSFGLIHMSKLYIGNSEIITSAVSQFLYV